MGFNISTSTTDLVTAISWFTTLSGVGSILTIAIAALAGTILVGYVLSKIRG